MIWVIAFIPCLLIVWLYAQYAARRKTYLDAYTQFSEEFYVTAEKLLDKEAISDEMINLIDFMNKTIADKGIAKNLFRTICDNAESITRNKYEELDWDRFIRDKEISEEEKQRIISLLKNTVGSWFRAILNYSPSYGRSFIFKMAECLANDGAIEPTLRASRQWSAPKKSDNSVHAPAAC